MVHTFSLAWAALSWKREHRPPALGVKFNRDPKHLAFILTQLWTYMEEYGANLPTHLAKVKIVIMALEGETADIFDLH